jgi:hypothetical protein
MLVLTARRFAQARRSRAWPVKYHPRQTFIPSCPPDSVNVALKTRYDRATLYLVLDA